MTERRNEDEAASAGATIAQVRAMRILSFVVGSSAGLYLALSVAPIVDQSSAAPVWWSVFAVLTTFALPLVTPFAVLGLPLRSGLTLLAFQGWLAFAALGIAPFVVRGLDPASDPWITTVVALGPAAIAIVHRARVIVIATVASLALLFVTRLASTPVNVIVDAVEDTLFASAVCAISVSLVAFVMHQARIVDVESAQRARRLEARAAQEAREAERERVDLLLHDTVLAALLGIARGDRAIDAVVRREAREALSALEERRDVDDAESTLASSNALAHIARVARAAHPDVTIERSGSTGARAGYPRAVLEAIAEATAEAVRNARHHAPTAATRVNIAEGVTRLTVTISDDGPGFDPDTVPAGRLGIRRSIVGRIHALEGGRVCVTSTPGSGTTIELHWGRE